LVIGSILLQTERAEKPLAPDAPAYPVEPFAQMAFLSLALANVFNLLGVWNAVAETRSTLAPRYDQFVITLVLYGAALPMTMVFALRTLPLFMRLAIPPRNLWRTLAQIYFVSLLLRVAPFAFAVIDDALLWTGRALRANYVNVLLLDALAMVGVIGLNVCVLVFVTRLDLFRRRSDAPPRRDRFESRFAERDAFGNRLPVHDPFRKPSRANYPDNGEYGRFELLIYSAYTWLLVAVIFDVLRALPVVNEMLFIPQDAARHALMLGFITLLIFGMAVRMLPGFSGKRRLAYPRLVTWLFVLGNLAALLRVAPLFFPEAERATWLLGASGIVGWSAVLVLAIVLIKTFRMS
jgi:hypothetical protein